MKQPFDIKIGENDYAVFPEGNDTYVIFKNGKEFAQVQKDTAAQWIKFDKETAIPLFEPDEEINALGKLIEGHIEEPEPDEEDGIEPVE
ncbi:MAG: hypothetical protein V4541_05265 [Bacteroidota bacterium]